MKLFSSISLLLILIAACNNKKANPGITPAPNNSYSAEDTSGNYFPVTNFLLGDINNIKTDAPTPIKKTIVNGKVDSIFLKIDSLNNAFKDFLNPIIDSANLKKYFSEKSFLDQTLASFTFTYERRKNIDSDFPFISWDVLVDQETNKVKRIYLVKKIDATTIKQLTWQAGKWCKVVTIANNKVIMEEKTVWDFEE